MNDINYINVHKYAQLHKISGRVKLRFFCSLSYMPGTNEITWMTLRVTKNSVTQKISEEAFDYTTLSIDINLLHSVSIAKLIFYALLFSTNDYLLSVRQLFS